jgi:hypothetical protein
MQLDPVFVVAPRTPPPSMTNRRAFLGMGFAFVAGSAFTAACYSMGTAAGPPDPASPSEDDLKPTGDNDLDELRRLAVKAPIEELVEKNVLFLMLLDRTYRSDRVLWKGASRLSRHVLSHPEAKDRRIIAKQLVPMIENDGPPAEFHLEQHLPELRRVAK